MATSGEAGKGEYGSDMAEMSRMLQELQQRLEAQEQKQTQVREERPLLSGLAPQQAQGPVVPPPIPDQSLTGRPTTRSGEAAAAAGTLKPPGPPTARIADVPPAPMAAPTASADMGQLGGDALTTRDFAELEQMLRARGRL